jgi:UDP-N-acetylglucosamine--N-acetylmuramyl-(pentapeptide) pyrophosphoryl-undecaprenol N-acetylglucosamine transferase
MESKKILDKKIVITGGGSGGHISAAQSLISELQKRYDLTEENFLYIGGDLGMVGEKPGNSLEQRKFKNASFNCKYIRAGKLQRRFAFSSIKLFFRTILGFADSYKIMKNSFMPGIIISTGGFVSVPVCLVGKLFGADIYLHEQTSTVGLANKIVSKIAKKVFVAFPSSRKYFPENKVMQTGNLLRDEIFKKNGEGKTADMVKQMLERQNQYPIVYISGGSLGSHVINETVRDSLSNLLENVQLIIQTGDNRKLKDYELLIQESKKLSEEKGGRVYITKYVEKDEIGYVFQNSDLFVGRAGANTVYEVGVFQIPSIFIPIPWVTNNEQFENAKVLKDLGLAEIVNEGELTPEKLTHTVQRAVKKHYDVDNRRLKEIFTTDAAKKIIDHIMK